MSGLVTVLPMAFVMIAGPQIISAVFLATSVGWARNSAAYIVGTAISITLVVTLACIITAERRARPTPPARAAPFDQSIRQVRQRLDGFDPDPLVGASAPKLAPLRF